MLNRIEAAARNGGWLLALAVAALVFLLVYIRAPGVPAPPVSQIIVFAPGSGFDVAGFCKDKTTKVSREMVLDATAPKYKAARGGQSVEWTVNPTGDALHYWINQAGQMESENVLVTSDALECMETPR